MSSKGVSKNVRDIISKMSVEEKAAVRAYLGLSIEKPGANPTKSIALFDLINSLKPEQAINDEEIQSQLYKTPNKVAFRRLLWRLREKILEVLLFDVNVDREGVYSERVRVNISIRKQLSQAQILQGRGLRKSSELILERTVDLCEKYELYEELLLALRFLIKQRSIDKGEESVKSLLEKYKKYDFCKNAVLAAEMNYRRIHSDVEFNSEGIISSESLQEILDNMSDDYLKSGSLQVAYYYYYIEAQYYQSLNNYKQARKSLLNIKKLFDGGASINIPCRIGGVFLNLADNDLFLKQFDRAYTSADEGVRSFHKGNFNYEQGIELMFYAKFYGGEYDIAANIIAQTLNNERTQNYFRTGKRRYLLANAFFMKNDFITTLKHLNFINPIESDREGWNIGIKILQILALIEQEQFDEATTKIDAFRKFVETSEVKSHRIKLINQLLVSLTYNGYDFKDIFQKEKGVIDMLGANTGGLAWTIKSPELVIFHQWIFAKATRQQLKLQIPSFQIDSPVKLHS